MKQWLKKRWEEYQDHRRLLRAIDVLDETFAHATGSFGYGAGKSEAKMFLASGLSPREWIRRTCS